MLEYNDHMKKRFFQTQNMQSVLLIAAFLIAAIKINSKSPKPFIKISKQDSAVNFNADLVDFFSLGYKRMITAFLWVSTILESDHEHYKQKDLNSWMYLRFKLISKLDPKFYESYAFGGPYLSIVKDDIPGASDIYKNGLKKFPNDFELMKNAAFHFYFEVNDIQLSRELYEKLIKVPNLPTFYTSIYAKIIGNTQSKEDAFNILKELYEKQSEDSGLKKHYFEKLYSIRAEIDLNCLNNNGVKCNKLDLLKDPYVYKNGTYFTSRNWKSFFKK